MKKKSINTNSSFDSIVYILSHATKMQLFWSKLRANDMLPSVPIFYYLKYYNNNFFKNLNHSIQMFRRFYIITHGLM
jgi:hypothetical protein